MSAELFSAIDEVASVDPDALSDAELHQSVIDLERANSLLAAARARRLAAWDARKTWADNGSKSAKAHRWSWSTADSAKLVAGSRS